MDHRLSISRVANCPKNNRLFRHIARESCGETFQFSDTDRVFFGYAKTRQTNKELVCAGSFCQASKDNDCHMINFLFVKSGFKGFGFGTKLLNFLIKDMESLSKTSTICVQSAWKAVSFFEANGFIVVGPPVECLAGGSPLFRKLYPMERRFPDREPVWDFVDTRL